MLFGYLALALQVGIVLASQQVLDVKNEDVVAAHPALVASHDVNVLGHKKHKHYNIVQGFFKQSSELTNDTNFDVVSDFGLYDNTSWDQLVRELEELNSGKDLYKLVFLQRHGEGYHNIAPLNFSHEDWSCYWKIQDGDEEGVEWYDSLLTETGHAQISEMSLAIGVQLERGLPLPEKFYVSPLRRTLQTWNLLFGPHTNESAVVTEIIREKYGISTSSKRHNKAYIEKHFPNIEFEEDFEQFDQLWDSGLHETTPHCQFRAKKFLDQLFKDKSTISYVVTHSGFISSVLDVIGHRDFGISTGQMIPVIIEQTLGKEKYHFDLKQPWKTYNCGEAGSEAVTEE